MPGAPRANVLIPGSLSVLSGSCSNVGGMKIDANKLIDRMAQRGRVRTNSEALRKVKQELEVVPPEILSAIDKNETRLIIVNKGEDPLSVNPPSGTPLLHAIEPESYGPMLSDALRPALANVESSVAHLDRVAQQALDPAMRALIEEQRFQTLDGEVQKRTGGLVRLLDPRKPTTLEQIARSRGARTSEEIESFAALTLTVSGPERTELATAGEDPALAEIFKSLPAHQRPVKGHLLIPSVAYFEKDGVRSLLHERVADWATMTRNGDWAGYYRSDVNTVFLKEEYLGETNEGTSTPVHEFGHAYGDMLSERYPAVFNTFKSSRDKTFVELHQDPARKFPTNYSAVNASEFVAETFAVRFDPDRESFPHDGGEWHQAFEQSLNLVIADERR